MDHENITWENNYKNVHENKQNMQQKKTSQVKKKKCIENVHEDKLIVKISCEKNRKNNVKINES